MSGGIKSDLLLKDELDPIDNSASSTLMATTSAFKSKDSTNGEDCIKDEFTDELEDVYCETNTDDGGGSGDQDTETDELNDAEEIDDRMTVMDEGEEEEEESVEMVGVHEGEEDHLAGDEEEEDSLMHNEDEEGEDDPLNDPLLSDHLLPSDPDLNGGEEEEEEEDHEDHLVGEEEEEDAVLNGDNHDEDMGGEGDSEVAAGSQQGYDEVGSDGKPERAAGGIKRKAGDADVAEEKEGGGGGGGTTSVRKSSRIRILLDLRKEKEEAMLQGKSVHDAQKEKTKMLQRPTERPTRRDEDAELSETEPDKDETEAQGPPPAVQGDPTRAPGADSSRKIDIDFLIPFRLGWTREVVHRSVKTGPPQVDIFYWPPKNGKDMGTKNREFRRKRRSKVDQERYFEDFPHPSLSVNNFSYVRRPLGLNNEAYELVRTEVRSGLETRSEKRTRAAGKVTSYKEVAEHVGLLSGSSSEEEKDNKEDEVEDITDFDQGLPLSIQILQRTTPLRDEFKRRHKMPDRERCLTPPLAEDIRWTQLDDDPLGIYTELGGRSSPATPPPLRALRLTSLHTVNTIRDMHQKIRDKLPDPLVRITAENKDIELKENLIGHDVAIKKWRNFRAAPVPQRFLPQAARDQQHPRRFLPPGRAPTIRPGPQAAGGRAAPPTQPAAGIVGGLPAGRANVGFVKVRLPMLSTNGKRPVVELVMLTNGKYQPIKFTNNRQVTESIPKRMFDQANGLKKTLYQRSVQVPKIGTKQVFVAINPALGGVLKPAPPPHPQQSQQQQQQQKQQQQKLLQLQQQQQAYQQHRPQPISDQVSILVRPAQGGNAVLLNVPRSVALKVKIGTTLSFSASNDQKYTVIDNKMHPPVGRGKPTPPPRPPQLPRSIIPNLPSSVSIRPVVRQFVNMPRPPPLPQQQLRIQQSAQQHFRQLRHEQIQQMRLKQRAAAAAVRPASPDLSSFTPCSPFCPGVSGIPELECSSCHSLFHPKCVGIPQARLQALSTSFRCKGCSARSGSGGPSVQVIDLD